ncbi:MAG: 2Fe-2S iron-sulfur cluster binding domain-containing protein [Gammaproteobacteria bacterium]|nr:2Fe-2S iron-sulfur cluster binding domain-containing protein [Gammaproteobacteria bacterium]
MPEGHLARFKRKSTPVNEEFVVKLARSEATVTVPAGGSILYSLLTAGIEVPYACGVGICGACEQSVLSGTPEHRDFVLSEEEQAAGRVLICCAGSRTPELELDL